MKESIPGNHSHYSIASTENHPARARLIGEVHDENAYALGGVAGHAGLFGTAGAVMSMVDGITSGSMPTSAKELALMPDWLADLLPAMGTSLNQVGDWGGIHPLRHPHPVAIYLPRRLVT